MGRTDGHASYTPSPYHAHWAWIQSIKRETAIAEGRAKSPVQTTTVQTRPVSAAPPTPSYPRTPDSPSAPWAAGPDRMSAHYGRGGEGSGSAGGMGLGFMSLPSSRVSTPPSRRPMSPAAAGIRTVRNAASPPPSRPSSQQSSRSGVVDEALQDRVRRLEADLAAEAQRRHQLELDMLHLRASTQSTYEMETSRSGPPSRLRLR